jgi:hypothetical protein
MTLLFKIRYLALNISYVLDGLLGLYTHLLGHLAYKSLHMVLFSIHRHNYTNKLCTTNIKP